MLLDADRRTDSIDDDAPLEGRWLVAAGAGDQAAAKAFARRLGTEGLEVVAAPGLQFWWSPEVLFESNVLLPVSNDTEGVFGELDWGFSFNLKLLF